MKLFQIDFQRLILLILPPCLRFPRIYALLLAMTFGIEELYRSFSRQREANLTRLRRLFTGIAERRTGSGTTPDCD